MAPDQAQARTGRPDANKMVGLGRFELPTSRLSSARSNQLSYKPLGQETVISRRTSATASSATLLAIHRPLIPDWARPRRKRNGDGGVPPSEIRGRDREITADRCPLLF